MVWVDLRANMNLMGVLGRNWYDKNGVVEVYMFYGEVYSVSGFLL